LNLNEKIPGPNGSICDSGAERLGDAILTMDWCRTKISRGIDTETLAQAALTVKVRLDEWFETDKPKGEVI